VSEWVVFICTSALYRPFNAIDYSGPSLQGWHLGTCQGPGAPKRPRATAVIVIAAMDDG